MAECQPAPRERLTDSRSGGSATNINLTNYRQDIMADQENSAAADDGQPQFRFIRTYLKDSSFESPNSPTLFAEEWKPEVKMQMETHSAHIEGKTFEVVFTVTVTAKQGEKTAFLAEAKQAGLFFLDGFDEARQEYMLAAYCPNLLHPFTREVIADLVVKGGFPQLLISPINFDGLYEKRLARGNQQTDTGGQDNS